MFQYLPLFGCYVHNFCVVFHICFAICSDVDATSHIILVISQHMSTLGHLLLLSLLPLSLSLLLVVFASVSTHLISYKQCYCYKGSLCTTMYKHVHILRIYNFKNLIELFSENHFVCDVCSHMHTYTFYVSV